MNFLKFIKVHKIHENLWKFTKLFSWVFTCLRDFSRFSRNNFSKIGTGVDESIVHLSSSNKLIFVNLKIKCSAKIKSSLYFIDSMKQSSFCFSSTDYLFRVCVCDTGNINSIESLTHVSFFVKNSHKTFTKVKSLSACT